MSKGTKEIAEHLIVDMEKNIEGANQLKEGALEYLSHIMAKSKSYLEYVPSENEFKDIVAEVIKRTVVKKYVPNPWRSIMNTIGITRKVIYAIDKYGLDRLFGKSWYDKIVEKAHKILDKND